MRQIYSKAFKTIVYLALRFLSGLLLMTIVSEMSEKRPVSRFKAAVYEHVLMAPPFSESPVSRVEALRHMQVNLDVYDAQAKAARLQGAEILVFPENGIYGYNFTRRTIRPYLELIPDPQEVTWSPCNDPYRFPNTEVQYQLSCMAKRHSIYIVANLGDIHTCTFFTTPGICPMDGAFQYNTAVAYDPNGVLVARYHKRNLYNEPHFDQPETRVSYFDTPFGRFGLFVCYDILYKSPAVDMVKEYGISNVVFPTAWIDALPLLSAIGWHSSFARGQGVNLLAANLHMPTMRVHGSGIYTSNGMNGVYYSQLTNSGPKLIVREIDVIHKKPLAPLIPYRKDNLDQGLYPYPQDTFTNKGYNFVALKNDSGNATVCQNAVCCSLDYSFYKHPKTELLVLGAFDGLFHNKYYSQICAVFKCPQDDRTKCGSYTYSSRTSFTNAKLRASRFVSKDSIFPQVVVSERGQLNLPDSRVWSWSKGDMSLYIDKPLKIPVVEISLVARIYSMDP